MAKWRKWQNFKKRIKVGRRYCPELGVGEWAIRKGQCGIFFQNRSETQNSQKTNKVKTKIKRGKLPKNIEKPDRVAKWQNFEKSGKLGRRYCSKLGVGEWVLRKGNTGIVGIEAKPNVRKTNKIKNRKIIPGKLPKT